MSVEFPSQIDWESFNPLPEIFLNQAFLNVGAEVQEPSSVGGSDKTELIEPPKEAPIRDAQTQASDPKSLIEKSSSDAVISTIFKKQAEYAFSYPIIWEESNGAQLLNCEIKYNGPGVLRWKVRKQQRSYVLNIGTNEYNFKFDGHFKLNENASLRVMNQDKLSTQITKIKIVADDHLIRFSLDDNLDSYGKFYSQKHFNGDVYFLLENNEKSYVSQQFSIWLPNAVREGRKKAENPPQSRKRKVEVLQGVVPPLKPVLVIANSTTKSVVNSPIQVRQNGSVQERKNYWTSMPQ